MSFQEYESRDELMDALADRVASELEHAITANGTASLAVPGGTTPAPFLQALSEIDLPWAQVNVLLGDERFVDENSDRSNTKLLKQNLFINEAAKARFVPLITSMKNPYASIEGAIDEVDAIMPLDVLVVGMGEDMHTASLFPDSPDLEAALSEEAPNLVVINAPNAGEPRISLSGNALRTGFRKHVLIVGEAKKAAYERALKAPTEMIAPIRTVLINDAPATVHYAK